MLAPRESLYVPRSGCLNPASGSPTGKSGRLPVASLLVRSLEILSCSAACVCVFQLRPSKPVEPMLTGRMKYRWVLMKRSIESIRSEKQRKDNSRRGYGLDRGEIVVRVRPLLPARSGGCAFDSPATWHLPPRWPHGGFSRPKTQAADRRGEWQCMVAVVCNRNPAAIAAHFTMQEVMMQ